MKRSTGFTLIEIMIVVAIIAILGSIAITAYSKSLAKAEFSEALTVTDGLKTNVVDYYHQTGHCPVIGDARSGLASNSASYAGKYVATADVDSPSAGVCAITATMRLASVAVPLRGKKVVLTADLADGSTSQWACTSDADDAYVPQACR